ncbi:MAG: DNA-directed RNA polymerase subunit B'' [Candidatus Woesearchaeota archaeon]|nr:MAG: DNA-directed RNA polymerase subunit B'' [Candidatus Woesearchaeota archaeon]
MIKENYKHLIKKYFAEHSVVESDIQSFNNFVDIELPNIVKEMSEIVPTIVPTEVEEFKITLDKIWVKKPEIVEADGSSRILYPTEARMRSLTYSAPIYLDVSAHVDGVQRESFTTLVGKLPIMVKSKYCHLHNLTPEQLIEKNEDPDDPGGYFILNGNERVLITVEDLATNKFFVGETSVGPSKFAGKLFSEKGPLRIAHQIEQMKDGVIYLSFVRFKRVPIIAIIKALGLTRDEEIVKFISDERQYDDVIINLYENVNIKTEKEALTAIAKNIGMTDERDPGFEKTQEMIDKYLLPHIGTSKKDRIYKAYNLCKLIKRFLMVARDGIPPQDKDHYMNKKLKLSGDLLADLFRVNMRVLVNDILYNFQRLVKRGKFQSIKIIIRDKLLTDRIKSAMATGVWTGGRKGISQNIDRGNHLATISHLQRVVSLLSTTQENFEARALHPTHWGRLCAVETPEGTSIGLRKNLALLCQISSEDVNAEKTQKLLEGIGLKPLKDGKK